MAENQKNPFQGVGDPLGRIYAKAPTMSDLVSGPKYDEISPKLLEGDMSDPLEKSDGKDLGITEKSAEKIHKILNKPEATKAEKLTLLDRLMGNKKSDKQLNNLVSSIGTALMKGSRDPRHDFMWDLATGIENSNKSEMAMRELALKEFASKAALAAAQGKSNLTKNQKAKLFNDARNSVLKQIELDPATAQKLAGASGAKYESWVGDQTEKAYQRLLAAAQGSAYPVAPRAVDLPKLR
jgi:hypothetical protein